MDGVSSIFAVLSLSLQLLDIVQKTSGFVKDIQDAPNELIELSETLSQLLLVLEEVHLLLHQRRMVPCLPGSPKYLLRALEGCEKKIKPLQALVQQAKETKRQGNRAQRTWASFKLVAKKERLRELQTDLRDAKLDLVTAISVNQSYLQMHHLQITIDTSRTLIESVNKQHQVGTPSVAARSGSPQASHSRPKGPKHSESSVMQKKTVARYQGIFGSARIDKTTKSGATFPCPQAERQSILAKETSIMVTPMFLRRRFEVFLNNHLGQISTTLSVYPVVSWKSSFFTMCRDGDIVGIQAALSAGDLTPFVLDEHGFTSLHWAAQGASPELCSWLLGKGLDPNRRSDYGCKALDGLGKSPNSVGNGRIKVYDGQVLGTDALIDTLRILGQAQEEVSALDLQDLWQCFRGPARDVELLYRQCLGFMEFQEEDSQLTCSYVLTKALWEYSRGKGEWRHLIRKMIHKGVDLHGRVCEAYIDEPDDCYLEDLEAVVDRRSKRKARLSMNGTPLDELFRGTVSLYGAESCAKCWLNILRREGVDVIAYLEKEFELHAAQQQLTYSGMVGTTRRQLVFSFGENPTVWWEWLLDPESGAYLVREEFKAMYTLWDEHGDLGSIAHLGRDVSPFDYPDWSLERMPPGERAEDVPFDYIYRRLDAEARLDRRWKKKASKFARARRTKGPRKIPGAWPT